MKLEMPVYTLKDLKTQVEWDISCSYKELQELLDAQENVIRVITPPHFTSSTATHANSKTSDGWKDLLGKIHKGAGRQSKIKK